MIGKIVRRALGGRAGGLAAATLLAATLAGCAGSSVEESGGLRINDPYENINRDIHAYNVSVDRYFTRPLAVAYDEITPAPVRFLVSNLLDHLELPRDFVSHLLSGDVMAAGRTFIRFGGNTIGGAGGLLDPATDFGLPKEDADFDVVLAAWGFEEGVFLELPFIGPSTTRHTVGRVVDIFLAPTTYIGESWVGPTVFAVRVLEFRADNKALIDDIYYGSVDSYVRSRSVYYQNRRRLIEGDVSLDESLPLDE